MSYEFTAEDHRIIGATHIFIASELMPKKWEIECSNNIVWIAGIKELKEAETIKKESYVFFVTKEGSKKLYVDLDEGQDSIFKRLKTYLRKYIGYIIVKPVGDTAFIDSYAFE